jgi:hypothetical protein
MDIYWKLKPRDKVIYNNKCLYLCIFRNTRFETFTGIVWGERLLSIELIR